MTTYDELLGPSAQWKALLDQGAVRINRDANRLVWTRDGTFAARLVPSPALSERLVDLPSSVDKARELIDTIVELKELAPTLESLQLTTTVGSLASVAGLAVAIAGFAAVMHKLERIDGKLDQLLGKVDRLQQAVDQVAVTTESFLFARLQAAYESLERSLAASTERVRLERARDAQGLFQEARLRYRALWRHADPWHAPSIPVATARELQARYLAAAVGELQAEFVLGDAGTFVHATRSVVEDVKKLMGFDLRAVFRMRSDAAVREAGKDPVKQALASAGELPLLANELKVAAAATAAATRRLEAAALDAELPALLGRPSHEILRAMRDAPGIDVYALGLGREGAAG